MLYLFIIFSQKIIGLVFGEIPAPHKKKRKKAKKDEGVEKQNTILNNNQPIKQEEKQKPTPGTTHNLCHFCKLIGIL